MTGFGVAVSIQHPVSSIEHLGWRAEIPTSEFRIAHWDLANWLEHMKNPPPYRSETSRLVPAIVTGLALVWTAGVAVVPWLTAHDSISGSWLRLVYRPGCHQIPDRCFDLGFGPLAVCARCMGLYIGGCLGLLWTTVRNRSSRPRPFWFLIAAVPTIVDFGVGQIGLPSLGNWPRFVVAFPLGLLAGLYLGDALIEIVRRNTNGQKSEFPQQDSVG